MATDELKRLCNMDAGVSIYKTVQALGYYDAYTNCRHCWDLIMNTNYEFIEFCNDEPSNWYAINEPGCWRVSRVDRLLERCDIRIERELKRKKKSATYQEYLSQYCFAKQKLDKPEAKFGRYLEIEERRLGIKEKSIVQRFEESVKNLETGELIARQIDYLIVPNPDGHTTRVMTRHCSYVADDYYLESFLIREVILP